jgi:hypothetical protein
MTKQKELNSGLTLPNFVNLEEGNIQLPILENTRPAITNISEECRREMIATSAYFIAEQRGFESGHEECDWLSAEAKINAYIR